MESHKWLALSRRVFQVSPVLGIIVMFVSCGSRSMGGEAPIPAFMGSLGNGVGVLILGWIVSGICHWIGKKQAQ